MAVFFILSMKIPDIFNENEHHFYRIVSVLLVIAAMNWNRHVEKQIFGKERLDTTS